jgi:hypothetical protein
MDLHCVAVDVERHVARACHSVAARSSQSSSLAKSREVVPGLVELEVAVPRLRPAVW